MSRPDDKSTRARALAAAAVVGVVGVAIGAAIVSRGTPASAGPSAVAPPPALGQYSVFSRAPLPSDALHRQEVDGALIPDATAIRRAVVTPFATAYVALGRSGRVCVILKTTSGGVGTSCGPLVDGVFLGRTEDASGAAIAVLVPDTVQRVATPSGVFEPSQNVAVLRDDGATELVIEGTAEQKTIPLSGLRPPEGK